LDNKKFNIEKVNIYNVHLFINKFL
jgi:hypothetical protein